MCTVTWLREEEGYRLFFNRDELRSRSEARPPCAGESGGVRWIAPIDPDFGGSWLAVNELGVTVGILNGYRGGDSDLAEDSVRSRGLLVTDLAGSSSLADVERRLATASVERYRSFRLVAVAMDGVRVAEWDRREIVWDRSAEGRRPLVSSSFDESEVGAKRRAAYGAVTAASGVTVASLEAYHRSHRGGPSAYSVCMHRENACTRSLSTVTVGRGDVKFAYVAGPPCEAAEAVVRSLPRVPDGSQPRSGFSEGVGTESPSGAPISTPAGRSSERSPSRGDDPPESEDPRIRENS